MKESQRVEWKESWRDDCLKWICGFANADGGVLDIGRNDKGTVVGLSDAKKLLQDIPNKIRDVLGIVAEVNLREENGKDYLEIQVEPYPYPVSYKGEYHYRSGGTKQELKGAALDRFLLRKQGRHWDAVPVPNVAIKDLSKPAVESFRKLARQSARLGSTTLRERLPSLFEKLHLLDGEYLKRAAVLLFHPDPERFVTGAFVKIGFFRTNADLLYHDEIHGDLFTQVSKTMDLLITKYLKAGIRYQRLQRVETLPVPEAALREALLNALVHKDYATGTPIQISVYSDKLMVWNPGELPAKWTVAKLKGKHPSRPFNPDLANAFFRAGLIEAWGRGIERILEACRAAGVPEPSFRYEPSELWVEFRYSKELTTQETDLETTQETAKTSGKTSAKTSGKTSGKRLRKTARAIVNCMLKAPQITIPELAEKLDRSQRAIELQISKLKEGQVIGRVGPANGGHWEVKE